MIPELDDPNNATSEVRWIATTSEADADRVRRANDRTGGIAARLVATLKRANARQTTKLKSIHLERVVIGAIESGMVNERTISGAVSQSLAALSEFVGTEADQRAQHRCSTPTRGVTTRDRRVGGGMEQSSCVHGVRSVEVGFSNRTQPGRTPRDSLRREFRPRPCVLHVALSGSVAPLWIEARVRSTQGPKGGFVVSTERHRAYVAADEADGA